MTTLEARIQEIEDREAIRELTAMYCKCAVQADVDAIVDLFTPDGIMESGDTHVAGHEKLRAMYDEAMGDLRPLPCVHNHIIEVEGDRARGTCTLELRGVADGTSQIGAGHYEDEFQRLDGGWKFSHRNLILYHMVPLSQGWA